MRNYQEEEYRRDSEFPLESNDNNKDCYCSNNAFNKINIQEHIPTLKAQKKSMLFNAKQVNSETFSKQFFQRQINFFFQMSAQAPLQQILMSIYENSTLEEVTEEIILRINHENHSGPKLVVNAALYQFYMSNKKGYKKDCYPSIYQKEIIGNLPSNRLYIQFDFTTAVVAAMKPKQQQKTCSATVMNAKQLYSTPSTLQSILSASTDDPKHQVVHSNEGSGQKSQKSQKRNSFLAIFGCCSSNVNYNDTSPVKLRKGSEDINNRKIIK